MNASEIYSRCYEFCLDWQMQGESRNVEEFKERFAELGLTFFKFSGIASANKWYVSSMDVLAD